MVSAGRGRSIMSGSGRVLLSFSDVNKDRDGSIVLPVAHTRKKNVIE